MNPLKEHYRERRRRILQDEDGGNNTLTLMLDAQEYFSGAHQKALGFKYWTAGTRRNVKRQERLQKQQLLGGF